MRSGGRIIGRINGSQLHDERSRRIANWSGARMGLAERMKGFARFASRTSNMPIRLAPMIGSGRLFDTRFGRCAQIRRIEIIFTGDSKPAEKRRVVHW